MKKYGIKSFLTKFDEFLMLITEVTRNLPKTHTCVLKFDTSVNFESTGENVFKNSRRKYSKFGLL